MENIFDISVVNKIIGRINILTPSSVALWGDMTVDKMLAHCNVTYEYVFESKYVKPKGFKKWVLKTFIKNTVVNDKPYSKHGMTRSDFLITNARDFEIEKSRLIAYINKVQELGESYFDNKESHSFGPLTKQEWNNMFYKHLDHHLSQFNV